MKKYNFYIYLIVHFPFSAVLIVYISVQRYKIYFVQITSSPLFCLLLDSFHVLLDLNKIMLLLYSRLNPPFVTTPSVISSHQSGSSHDRILVNLCSWREDMSADLGQADDGHHTNQQPFC